jgi:hypothetical protein
MVKHKLYCSLKCWNLDKRKVVRPLKEELHRLLWNTPTVQIARNFNITDKAIEKWVKDFDLEKPKRGFWAKIRSGIDVSENLYCPIFEYAD